MRQGKLLCVVFVAFVALLLPTAIQAAQKPKIPLRYSEGATNFANTNGGGGGGGGLGGLGGGMQDLLGSLQSNEDVYKLVEQLGGLGAVGDDGLKQMFASLNQGGGFGDLANLLGGGSGIAQLLQNFNPESFGGLDKILQNPEIANLLQNQDIGKLLGGLDFSKLLGNLDFGKLLGNLDFEKLLGGFDLNQLMQTFDVDKLAKGTDLEKLVQNPEVANLVKEFQTSGFSGIKEKLASFDLDGLTANLPPDLQEGFRGLKEGSGEGVDQALQSLKSLKVSSLLSKLGLDQSQLEGALATFGLPANLIDPSASLTEVFTQASELVMPSDKSKVGGLGNLVSEFMKKADSNAVGALVGRASEVATTQAGEKFISKLASMLGGMGGLGGAADPGERLRQLQKQTLGGGADMTQVLELLDSVVKSGNAHTLLEQMGLAKFDTNDPEEAERQAQVVIQRLTQAMSMGGLGSQRHVIVPDHVLWVVVVMIVLVFGGAVWLLVHIRKERDEKRKKVKREETKKSVVKREEKKKK